MQICILYKGLQQFTSRSECRYFHIVSGMIHTDPPYGVMFFLNFRIQFERKLFIIVKPFFLLQPVIETQKLPGFIIGQYDLISFIDPVFDIFR